MLKLIRPARDVTIPSRRSEIVRLLLLARGHGYVADALLLTQQDALKDAEIVDIPPKPPHYGIEHLLLLFPGGIGDVLCLRACLSQPELKTTYPHLKEIAIASYLEDRYLIGGHIQGLPVTFYDYPVPQEVYDAYDACVNYGPWDKRSERQSLWANCSQPLKLPIPQTVPRLIPDNAYKRAMQQFLKGDKAHIGIQIEAAAFFRSWHPAKAYAVALALAQKGYSIYFIGHSTQRLKISNNMGLTEPDEGIYDMGGLIRNLGELVAFVDLMDVIISIDSGIMHIAGSLGKPTIALFAITDAHSRSGLYPSVLAIEAEAECSPCWAVYGAPPCNKPFCEAIAEIPLKDIIESVELLLGQNRPD